MSVRIRNASYSIITEKILLWKNLRATIACYYIRTPDASVFFLQKESSLANPVRKLDIGVLRKQHRNCRIFEGQKIWNYLSLRSE